MTISRPLRRPNCIAHMFVDGLLAGARGTHARSVGVAVFALAACATRETVLVARAGDRLPLAIRLEDPLQGAAVRSRRIDCVAEQSGTLWIWATSDEIDLALRVEDEQGRRIAENDDSGGACNPCLTLSVEAGQRLRAMVESKRADALGAFVFGTAIASESDSERRASEDLKAKLAEAARRKGSGDADSACAVAADAVARLHEFDGVVESDGLAVLSRQVGALALGCGLPELASKCLEIAVLFLEQHAPPTHPELWRAKLTLARAWEDLGALHRGLAVEEAALPVFERTFTEEHQDFQFLLLNLGVTRWRVGDVHGARELFERLVEIQRRTRPPDDPATLASEANLAVVIKDEGDLRGALALEQHVLDASRRRLPLDDPDIYRAMQNLSNTLHRLGEYDRARDLDEAVLAARELVLPDDHPELLEARLNLAASLSKTGDIPGARVLDERVLGARLSTLPEEDPRVLAVMANLAADLWGLGDLEGARELMERLLTIREGTFPADHPDLLLVRTHLAGVLRDLGDDEHALSLHRQVVATLAATFPADHPDLVAARQGLGLALAASGDVDAAEEQLTTVLRARESALPVGHPDRAIAEANVARVRILLGDRAGALPGLAGAVEALALSLTADDLNLLGARADLAWTLAVLEQDAAAERETRSLVDGLRARAHRAVLSSSPREAESCVASVSDLVSVVISLAAHIDQRRPGAGLEDEALELVESVRGAGLTSAGILAASRGEPRDGELRAEVLDRATELARLSEAGAPAGEMAAARRRREKAERSLLEHIDGDPRTQARLAAPTRERLAKSLAPGQAAVSIWRCGLQDVDIVAQGPREVESVLIAYVLRGDSPVHRVDLGPADTIEAAVGRWRSALGVASDARGLEVAASGTTADDEARAGAELRALVLDPLEDALAGASAVRIALDGALHLVPLDALPEDPDSSDQRVGERRRIEIRSTLRECLAPHLAPAGPAQLVAFGGLDYAALTSEGPFRPGAAAAAFVRSGDGSKAFQELAETGAEVEAIRALCPAAESEQTILTGARGSRAAFLDLAPGARWLHLATHGWFAPEVAQESGRPVTPRVASAWRANTAEPRLGPPDLSPLLLCGIALAGANAQADGVGRSGGAITAEEIAALDLSNCDLAVLSACDTAIGTRRAGQGVASLQKALHMAGARSVITSLWKVPDEATKELMIDFYRRLWVEKKPKHQALWEAKTKLRDAKDERGSLKYSTRDWAAWVLTGEPD